MNEQGGPYRNLPPIVEHLQALESAHAALLGDIKALRQAVLKGSRLSQLDCENLATHLRETQTLLTAAGQACEEIILSLATTLYNPQAAGAQDASRRSGALERRRVPRRSFGGVAEISIDDRDAPIIGLVSELSRFGCFVRTHLSATVGTKVSLKITHHGHECAAGGEVVHLLSQKGIGIKFEPATPRDEALLEDWLRQTMI